jgi:hypothetical protein
VAKKRVAGAVKTPKSDVEIILDIAIRKHAKRPDLIKEIERTLWEFQKRELSGEMPDRHAALQEFSREIERVGATNLLPPKDPGPKPGPITKMVVKYPTAKAPSWARKGKQPTTARKRPNPKRIYVK